MGSVRVLVLLSLLGLVVPKPIITPNNSDLPPNVLLLPPPILETYIAQTTLEVPGLATREGAADGENATTTEVAPDTTTVVPTTTVAEEVTTTSTPDVASLPICRCIF
ncbi:uncharacterized protein LOC116161567 [Photinus pyralis]|uniref:uncharacterized protein LOC116161567 n=1 Tax=Photinus pyralis TaxID=7054 RepID=UPI0012673347|nr:uncharacterized protein LOC116161567 [Photinus pyralis]